MSQNIFRKYLNEFLEEFKDEEVYINKDVKDEMIIKAFCLWENFLSEIIDSANLPIFLSLNIEEKEKWAEANMSKIFHFKSFLEAMIFGLRKQNHCI